MKIIPLKTNRLVLTWFCVYPPEQNTNKWKKLAYAIFALSLLVDSFLISFSSIASILAYISTDFEESLFALMQLFAGSVMIYVVVITFFLRHKIVAICDSLTRIYEASKDSLWILCVDSKCELFDV